MADPPGLDLAALRAYLDRERPGLVAGPLAAQLIAGGRSNLTYTVGDGAREWVLRRPPLGHVLATAHDMSREFRVMSALAGSNVPVPATVLLCQDEDVLGAPFYLMVKVEGTVFRTSEQVAAALSRPQARELSFTLVDVLAELHAVDYEAVGLGDFGRPDGYLQRQVRRWRGQLDKSRSREVDGIDELHDTLAASVPASQRAAIVHGDFRLDNVIVDADRRVAAVLDWEMSTLGDPLADLGLMVVYWRTLMPLAGATEGNGFAAVDEVIAHYGARTGLDLSHVDWYVGFGFFKLAVVAEGIYYRYTLGKTVGDGFERYGELVPQLVRQGNEVLTGRA
ncbi:MAG TPA: phosphotransferase family protein [Pseudonocardiaceae bacterium]|nr:phosphotransferase family protein [Pseudonocardiaceae bacterium]